jgi:Xaa-Pro aminopeptidase
VSATAASTRSARADRLMELLEERDLDCLLVTDLVNLRYLTGFTGTNGACVVARDERVFLTDFRYVELAEEQVHGFERITVERDVLADVAARLRGKSGFDEAHLSVADHRKLEEKVADDVELVPAAGLVERLREVKDEGELRAIAEAAKLADRVYDALFERGIVGSTEREVARWLEHEVRDRGAEPAFPVIVAAGPNGARPHAVPGDAAIPANTLVVVDMGARLEDYCSDCTRTLATGKLEEQASEVYELVRVAQETALGAIRAGVGCRDADAVAREVIESAGHGERFGHGLGHGVGLEVHEGPRLSKKAEGELRAGNVVTVEPGVYLPGEFGVRIEDLVVVRDDGCDVLTGFSKALVTVD